MMNLLANQNKVDVAADEDPKLIQGAAALHIVGTNKQGRLQGKVHRSRSIHNI